MTPAEDTPILRPVERTPHHGSRFDPEFDSRPPALTVAHRVLLPQYYQRLVANPFLAVAALIAWLRLFRSIWDERSPFLMMLWGAGLFFVVTLLQFHCLDCGKTGWLFRWPGHACARVVERQRAGRVRPWRGPNPSLQLVVWIYILLSVVFLGSIAFLNA